MVKQVEILLIRAARTLPYLTDRIAAARAAGRRVLVMVPEQFTLQAEWELTEGLGAEGLLQIDVYSPGRLSRLIREKAGGSALQPLDSLGRSMVLRQSLNQIREELSFYGASADMRGLPEKFSALIADMQRVGMTPQVLAEQAGKARSPAFRARETDISRVWACYEDHIRGRFADEAGQQAETLVRAEESGVFQDAALFVCGFDVLPLPQCKLLAEAAKYAAELTVAICAGAERDADAPVFLAQHSTVNRLMKELARQEIGSSVSELPGPAGRAACLRALEQRLFSVKSPAFTGDGSPLVIHMAANPWEEALWAAAQLRGWHEAGIPWGRMAVALAETASLPGVMSQTLRAAGIPFYSMEKQPARRHGLSRLLISALRTVCGGYQQEDVLEVLASGFLPMDSQDLLKLENYALEQGIRRRKWLQPFTRGEQAAEMEPLRQQLTAILEKLHTALRRARNAMDSAGALFAFLEDTQAYEQLRRREEELLNRGMMAEASQNRQIWKTLMNLLDQLYTLLGSERAKMAEIADLIEAGLEAVEISALPAASEQVIVGQAGHMLLGPTDALCLCGMQDGAAISKMDSLITEEERMFLSGENGVQVGISEAEQSAMRRADFYRCVTIPDRFLSVSWSCGDLNGESLRPSGLLSDMERVVPGARRSGGAAGEMGEPLSPQLALEALSVRLRGCADGTEELPDGLWPEALRRLWRDPEWHTAAAHMLAGLHAQAPAPRLSPEEALSVMQRSRISISRLERFAECPYKHFVAFGLRPMERREFLFQSDEKGSFFHAVLQRYTLLAAERPAWPNLPDSEIEQMMDEAVRAETEGWEGGPLTEDAIGRAQGEEYIRTVRRAAWVFTRHARSSRFTAAAPEVRFGAGGSLPPLMLELADGRKIALEGAIDRIDRWQDEDSLYLRVMDYKSSSHSLDYVKIRYGLQLQLMLYLKAATEGAGALPAGVFYFHIHDPRVDTPDDIREAAEHAIATKLQLKGIGLADVRVWDAMAGDGSEIMPKAKSKSKDDFHKNAAVLDLDEMRAAMDYAQRQAAELTSRIYGGEIDIRPVQIGDDTACANCRYHALCGRDPSLRGMTTRDLSDADKEECKAVVTGKSEADAGGTATE